MSKSNNTNTNTINTNSIEDQFNMTDEQIIDLYTPTPTSTKTKRDYTTTPTQVQLLSTFGTKSQAIRSLHKEGKTTSEIADLLNIRYQHVRNVLNQKMKKGE